MQLKRKRSRDLRRALIASSCALLGTAAADAQADAGDWSFDAGLLYYSEQDRVTDWEPAFIAKRDLGDGSSLSFRFVADTLTGATPTGAMASDKAATSTGASGGVSSGAGVLPTAPFSDLRKAVEAAWSQRLSEDWRVDLGADYSIERDFRSEGVNALFSRDFDRHNTTLSFGLSYEGDDVFPHGGVQVPESTVPTSGPASAPIASHKSKTVDGALLGLTQTMSKDWLLELNYSYGYEHGYLNDPYKVVSILNTHLGGAGIVPGFPGGPGGGGFGPSLGAPLSSIYENRPGERREQALFLVNKVAVGRDVVDFSVRYGRDDWGIGSRTFELRYRWAYGDDYYLQPHLRYYRQSQADFYQRALLDSDTVPAFVSADYRLAAITGRTVGLEWGVQDGHRFRVRLERYVQGGQVDPRVLIGVQQGFDSFPELKAWIAQASWSF